MKLAIILLFLCSKLYAQDVSHVPDGMRKIRDTAQFPIIDSSGIISQTVYQSRLGTIEYDGKEYWLTDKERRVKISKQLADLLTQSYQIPIRTNVSRGTLVRKKR